MKALTSILVMFIVAGCSNDAFQPEPITNNDDLYKKSGKNGKNRSNPHAQAGAVYQELLNEYYLLPKGSGDMGMVIARIDSIAAQNTEFALLNSASPYSPLSTADVAPYLNGGELSELLSQDYSAHAADILMDVAVALEDMKAQDLPYQDVESYFRNLDSNIQDDPLLPDEEKEALFTTTTIICNALDNDRKRKRRDRDWEWMTTHLAGTANAAMESIPQAIMMSLAIDVYHD